MIKSGDLVSQILRFYFHLKIDKQQKTYTKKNYENIRRKKKLQICKIISCL